MTDMNNMLDKVQKLLALAIIVPEDVKDKFGEKFPQGWSCQPHGCPPHRV